MIDWKDKFPGCYGPSGRVKQNLPNTKKLEILKFRLSDRPIEIVGDYVAALKHIACRCSICTHEWSPTPNGLLNGKGCPECTKIAKGDKLRKTHPQFVEDLEAVNSVVKVLGLYKNSSTKLECLCSVCGYTWQASPNHLLAGTGCPACNHSGSDTLYYWVDEQDNYKIGITAESTGLERLRRCSTARKTEIVHHRLVRIKEPFKHEQHLLDRFKTKPYSSGDGYTEFRTLNNKEKQYLNEYMDKLEKETNDSE